MQSLSNDLVAYMSPKIVLNGGERRLDDRLHRAGAGKQDGKPQRTKSRSAMGSLPL